MSDNTSRYFAESELTVKERRRISFLHKKSRQLFRNLARCESKYHDLGLKFFWYPTQVRERLIQDASLKAMFIKSDNVHELPPIQAITVLRRLRDELQDALRRCDVQQSTDKFRAADLLLDGLQDDLISAEHDLTQIHMRYTCGEGGFDDNDEGLPYFDEGQRIGPRERAVFGDKFQDVFDWAMTLPEVRFQIDTGRATADDAFILAIRTDEDGVGLNEELEFSEIESEDLLSDGEDNEDEDVEAVCPLHGAWAFR